MPLGFGTLIPLKSSVLGMGKHGKSGPFICVVQWQVGERSALVRCITGGH